ncbi:MAG: efflux RND transporter periplasmic adaptor subunit, partial [Candidatus Levybacteria bacterium]|nr:efflux RND transporter periplasmic adaptor subunit [Candidatus Levybacteria bacterium]
MKKAPVKRTLPTRQVIIKKISTGATKTVAFVDRHPMRSFFAVLGTVLVLIFVGNFLNKPKAVTPEEVHPVKAVSTYSIGSAPKITVSAQTKKSGVIQVVALSGGLVDKINVQEGSQVLQGDQLLAMASNYKGENVASISRQVADREYQSKASTYKTEKEIIKRQKELAEANEEDKEELRKITE